MHNTSFTPYELYIDYKTLSDIINDITQNIKEPVIINVLVAIELTAALIQYFKNDNRKTIDNRKHIKRISYCLIAQLNLTKDLFENNTFDLPFVSGFEDISSKLLFKDFFTNTDDNCSSQIQAIVNDLPIYLGIENISNIRIKDKKEILNINYFNQIEKLHLVNRSHNETPEDFLFCVIHQITECWLNIFYIYIEKTKLALYENIFFAAQKHIFLLSEILEFLIKNIELLNLMVHKDYHPLRVKLRDASGAQSVKAKNLRSVIIDLSEKFTEILSKHDLSLLDILRNSEDYPEKYICFSAILELIKNCRAFLLNHFLLASNTIGQKSMGSLGFEVNKLANHFLQPLAPEYEQALYDFTVITNFQYSDTSGEIIMFREQKEKPYKYDIEFENIALSKQKMKSKAIGYFFALQNKEINDWLMFFDPVNCQFREHLSSKPYIGLNQIKIFAENFLSTAKNINYKFLSVEYFDNSIIINWDVKILMYNDNKIKFTGYEKLTFNAEYQITSVESDWNSECVVEQLLLNHIPESKIA
jgi:hypothetical protein